MNLGGPLIIPGPIDESESIGSSGEILNYVTWNGSAWAPGHTSDAQQSSAIGLIVESGGSLSVTSGGFASDVVISSGGDAYVNGGSASGTVISSGGEENVYGGGSATGDVISSGGEENVYGGGSATGDVISSGGEENVYGGGSATGAVVSSGGEERASSGGSTIGTVIGSGGEEDVDAGGFASGTTISNGGEEEVNRGTAIGTVISSGGEEDVYSGGSASGTVIGSGGVEFVYSGGSASGTIINSGGDEEDYIGGFESGAVVSSGGTFSLDGGQASGVVVSSGGALDISFSSAIGAWTSSSGGEAIDGVTVLPGAEVDLNVELGASISGFVASSGDDEYVSGGGSAYNSIINSGGSESVEFGGFESGAVVNSGGQFNLDGGQASGVVVKSGGSLDIFVSSPFGEWTPGASFTGVTVSAGAAIDLSLESGGSVSGFVASSGAELDIYGGLASGATIESGGYVPVLAGGSATGTIVNGGGQLSVQSGGSASDSIVNSGGDEWVQSGGSASDSIINNGGHEWVYSGGFESGAIVESGGTFSLEGGQASGVVVSSGGSAGLSVSSAVSAWTPSGGGSIDGVTVLSGASVDLSIDSGGSISGFVASSGGDVDVESGGSAIGTIVDAGGSLQIQFGSASGSIINSGGYEDLYNGSESGAVVNSGGTFDLDGGQASDVVVNSGGTLDLDGGQASGVVVSSGGAVDLTTSSPLGDWTPADSIDGVTVQAGARLNLSVASGGSVSGFVVSSGEILSVESGGSASDTIIESGGFEWVASGGFESGAIVDSGGAFSLGGGPLGVVGGQASDVVVSSGGTVELSVSSAFGAWTPSSSQTIDGVTILPGAVVDLTLEEGGSVSGFIVGSGAYLFVDSGGSASDAVVESGGTLVLYGGQATGAVVSSGGFFEASLSSAYGAWTPSSSQTIDGVTVQAGATVGLEVEFGRVHLRIHRQQRWISRCRSGGRGERHNRRQRRRRILSLSAARTPASSSATATESSSLSELGGPPGSGASLDNMGSVIAGSSGVGVEVRSGGSVLNAGSISGTTAAVEFDGAGSFLLDLEGGSTLSGAVLGSTTSGATNQLVLSGSGTSNSTFTGFNTLTVGSGASWSLGGTSAIGATTISGGALTVSGPLTTAFTLNGGTLTFTVASSDSVAFEGAGTLTLQQAFTGAISGYVSGDVIDLPELTYVSGSSSYAVGTPSGGQYPVTVSEGSATAILNLASSASPQGELELVSDATGGTEIEFLNGSTTVAPTILGTVAGQKTTSEAPVKPFANVTIGDVNANATDTLTIALSGAGALSGTGLLGSGAAYTLTGAASTITSELDALSFTPAAGGANTTSTTTFTLSDLSNAYATAITNSTTTVINSDPAVAPTIAGTVVSQTTTSEAPVSPFANVTIGDVNANATDTLTITLTGKGGSLSGVGLTPKGSGVYALSGAVSIITSDLDALSFTPTGGAPGTSSTTTFTLSDLSSAYVTPTADGTTTVVDNDPAGLAPTITGTLSGQKTTSEAAVSPFAKVTINDPTANATETLTISLSGPGGALTGTGFTVSNGIYTLSGAAATVTSELDALSFTPAAGKPNTSSTTTFILSDLSSAYGTAIVNSTTTVIDSDPAVAQTITGTVADQSTTSEAAVSPFAKVTITDPNANATDTLTITLSGGGGTLSGTGLSGSGGSYTLTGAATAITSELDALSFTPTAGAANTTSTTTFALSDASSAYATPVTDSTTSVIDKDLAVPPTITGAVAGLTTTLETGVSPFAKVTITDSNAGATDALTIALSGSGGTLADGSGYSGLVTKGANIYALSGTAQAITAELDALVFTPSAVWPNSSGTTSFALSDASVASSTTASDSTTSVIDDDPSGNISVSSAYLLENLAGIAADTQVTSITLTDAGTPILNLTPSQVVNDAAAINKATYANGSPVEFAIGFEGAVTVLLVGGKYELATNTKGIWTGPTLQDGSSAVTLGQFGAGVTPVGAMQTGNGYEVAWSLGSNQYIVWNTDLNGDYTSSATGVLTGSSPELEAVEGYFGEPFAGGGTPATPGTPTNGITAIGDLFELNPGGGTGPLIQDQGSLITSGGVWAPIAAVKTGNGYEVAWADASANQYIVWNTDLNGDYTSSATGVLTGSSPELEAVEGYFGEPFAGGGTPTTPGTTANGITAIGDLFELDPGGGTGSLLQSQGSFFTAVSGAAWTPVAAAALSGGGYEVAWKNGSGSSALYTVWDTDANGDYVSSATGVVSGGSYALEDLELSFGEDLNGDGTIGPTTTSIGTNGSLALVANQYALESGGTIQAWVEDQGSPITSGGVWAPVGAVKTGNGYEVAWADASANQYIVWNTDLNGDYTSSATGVLTASSPELEAVEGYFGEQFAGGAGTPATPGTTANGITAIGDLFELNPGGGTGPLIQDQGSLITSGGVWAPIAAVKTGNGYEVAWADASANQYIVWNTDLNGDYTSSATGVLTGSSPELEAVEGYFGEPFAGGGTPTTPGTTANGITAIGDLFELDPGGGTGPLLQSQGSLFTAVAGAAWTPVAAAALSGGGYEVAWKNGSGSSALYTVWDTDANGDYVSSATGVLSGGSYALEDLELSFGEDLNGDGTIGPTTTSIGTNGSLALVANQYALESGGTIQAWVEDQGSPITSGGAWAPIGAVKTGNGYEVAWVDASANAYTVWNTDVNGDYTSSATGVLTASSQELEAVEGYFGEPFAGGGTPATPGIATNGVTAIGDLFELNPGGGTGPLLQYQGSLITSGGVWTPISAVKTGNGYEVAWGDASANEYTVWNTDANGDYTSSATGVLTGSSSELEAVEGYFGEQFAGGAGTPATPGTTANGITAIGDLFELNPGGGTGPLLQYQGSLFTASLSAAWAPIAAVKTGNGYEVAWGDASANEYTVWNTDANGDYTSSATGVLTGSSSELEAVEGYFGEQFAGGAGTPATPGTTANGITAIGDLFELNPGGGTGPLLQYQGNLATSGGTWSPVAAEKTATGYEVAWSLLGSDQYTVWNTDANGDYTSSATGVVSGQSFALEDLEPAFGEELNGDGRAPSATLITSTSPGGVLNLSSQTQSATINLGANSASANAGLNAPSLGFTGTPDAITLGADPDIVEYALTPSSGIETISNFVLGQDELNIDLMGAANSTFEIYNTMVGGQHAISIFSSVDPNHGVVLLNMPSADTAAVLSASHLTLAGGHALIS